MRNPFRPAEGYRPAAILITLLFSFAGIAVLGILDSNLHNQYLVASFGSTAVLIYAVPKAPLSRPKNVFFGHVFSAIVSMAIVWLFAEAGLLDGLVWVVCGLCVSVSITVMILTGTIHPPAGATALTCALSQVSDPLFLFFPLIFGLVAMMALAYGANRLKERYAS